MKTSIDPSGMSTLTPQSPQMNQMSSPGNPPQEGNPQEVVNLPLRRRNLLQSLKWILTRLLRRLSAAVISAAAMKLLDK